jgi:DNA-directed RNA polymerase subunit RPC12/RpoP
MPNYLSDKDIDSFFNKDKNPPQRFTCRHCGKEVDLDAPGTKNRNHCPFCLFSVHVDEQVGDRKSQCQGLMEPIGKFLRPNGEEVIIHKCTECGKLSNNRIAGDDNFELVGGLFIIDENDKIGYER